MTSTTGTFGRVLRTLLLAWLIALGASYTWQAFQEPLTPAQPVGKQVATVRAVGGEGQATRSVRLAYRDLAPAAATGDEPVVVLLHGSPGRSDNFGPAGGDRGMAVQLAKRFRVIVPDLPGFGDSDLRIPDYSIAAHADYLEQLLDELQIPRAHLVGYSMGGGPALLLWERAPERVASVTLLSSIGVQELELLGDYTMNHGIHGLQLGAFATVRAITPHFGSTDALDRAVAYARNFFDTDQRPLRPLLERFEPPLLVIHGGQDFLVPVEAAREHHRIVPHSELWLDEDASHFMVFADRPPLLEPLVSFVERAERGEATRRGAATAARLARATEPFDPSTVPAATGFLLVVLMVLIALATLVSEDLTCIGAGLMAARGQLSWVAASTACFLGIFVGDMLLFVAGRVLGRPAIRRAPLRWMVTPEGIARSQAWFDKRGPAVILLSRFMPGMRLPTYVAAGVLGTSFLKFCLWFVLAGLLWTPALVGLSMIAGKQLLDTFAWLESHPVLGLGLVAGVLLVLVKLVVPMFSHRGRRLLKGRWMRWTRWEFWPPWLFYPPIVLYVAWLCLKNRSASVVTAVNPCMPAGGIIGESKGDILDALRESFGDQAGVLPATIPLPGALTLDEREARVLAFMAEHGLEYPVVLKPDAGQRGSGVAIVHRAEDVRDRLERAPVDLVVQEFVTGEEFGVFYARQPGEERGEVFSITEKRRPSVTGDGRRTVEELILDDDRAPAMAKVYFENLSARLTEVPAAGEAVCLTEVGAHARGTVFLDGNHLHTPELEARIDALSRRVDGFYFGRYDILVPSAEHLSRGEGLRIIELNGLTSEATHIYDARCPLSRAYRTLGAQWRRAFRIGRANRAAGAPTTSVFALLGMTLGFLRTARRRKAA